MVKLFKLIWICLSKYLDLILINILALLGGILFNYCFGKEVEILTAFIATGLSLSFGIRQYKIENDKMFKELF